MASDCGSDCWQDREEQKGEAELVPEAPAPVAAGVPLAAEQLAATYNPNECLHHREQLLQPGWFQLAAVVAACKLQYVI